MDVIIVCHTEFGFVHNKKVVFDKKAKGGTRKGSLNLIKIADKYRVKITFAVCPEVASFFPRQIEHEIGLHIHPGWRECIHNDGFNWFIGDLYLKKYCNQSVNSTILGDYSYEEQLGMIKTGKDYLNNIFGGEPKSFVAGRWSINNDTVKALIKAGITHECSATSHTKPCHHDWSKLPRICPPYHPSRENYQKKGNLSLLIVPISQSFPRGNVNIESIPTYGLSWLKACFSEYYRQNVPLFHICLHSPIMTDSYFISAMDEFLKFMLKHKNINFKFASEIKEYPEKSFKTNVLPYIFATNKKILKIMLRKILTIS